LWTKPNSKGGRLISQRFGQRQPAISSKQERASSGFVAVFAICREPIPGETARSRKDTTAEMTAKRQREGMVITL
jgi:hypothetical protein